VSSIFPLLLTVAVVLAAGERSNLENGDIYIDFPACGWGLNLSRPVDLTSEKLPEIKFLLALLTFSVQIN